MNTILQMKEHILKKQNKWSERLHALQNICEHENVVIVNKGNTGNYDPSANSYWSEYSCNDCGKFWIKETD